MKKADRRRAQRRKHHSAQHSNPPGGSDRQQPNRTRPAEKPGEQETFLPKLAWWWWPVGLGAGPLLGAVLAPLISDHPAVGWTRASGAVIAVATFLTLVLVVKLSPILGKMTTVAALSIAVSGFLAVLALLAPTCPGRVPGTGCTREDVVSFGMVGLLTPVVVALIAAGPLLAYRFARITHEAWGRWLRPRGRS